MVWYSQTSYSEQALFQGIIDSLIGDATKLVHYMGLDVKVSDIIDKLENQYGQVASSDTLLQSFYQMVHEKGKHTQTFVARLEGSLNQLWLCFPSMVAKEDVGYQWKEKLFYGMSKPLCDGVQHLCDNPNINYTQLMVAAQKAEGEVAEKQSC